MGWTYEQAEDHVLDLERFGMRFGTERMHALLEELGSPQKAFGAIHVVGSNGKSSTVRMAAAILQGHGHTTGAYTSPHIGGFNERIQIAGKNVSREDFAGAIETVARAAQVVEAGRDPDDLVSQFETLTAAAFLLLAGAGVELAVIEAGLGGRHDSTNVLSGSRVQVLTNVSLEHTRWLGDTIAAIAAEKVEVVRPGATLVVGAGLAAEAMEVAQALCAERGAKIVVAPADPEVELAAAGPFQRRNFALAREAALAQLGELDPAVVERVAGSITVPGRFEVREPGDGGATVVLDGAHNQEGTRELCRALAAEFPGRRIIAVVSILEDKDAAAMLETLGSCCDQLICTHCTNPRSLLADGLMQIADRIQVPASSCESPDLALRLARELAGPGGVAVATGSLYLLADLTRAPGPGRVSRL